MSSEKDNAGRGTAAIALAKIYFVLAGFGVQFALPRFLGSPERFGEYSSAMNGVSIFNNVMIAATVQTVSKLVSENEAQGRATLRQALSLQLVLGIVVAGAIASLAGPVAATMHDPEFGELLRVASIVVLAYAIYAALVGALNGTHRFVTQARFDISFTTIRTVALLVGAAMFGVAGAIAGFASAAVLIAAAALVVVGSGESGEGAKLGRFVSFMAPIWLYQGCLNGLLLSDQILLKQQIASLGVAAGMAVRDAVEVANTQAGLYKAAQNFAFVPYQLVITATLVVFPMVSRATASGDLEAAKKAIGNAGRFSFLALAAMAAPMVGAASGVLRILYAPEYVVGADALAVLTLGLVAFTLFALAATILAGEGRPGIAAGIALGTLIVMLVVDRLVLGAIGISPRVLVALAAGTSSAMALAAIVSIGTVIARFGTFIPLPTLARGAIAAGCGGFVAHLVPHASRLTAVLALAAGVAVYAVVLLVSGELRDVVALVRARRAKA